MAFIPTPTGIRVTLEGSLYGVPVVNVVTVDCGTTPDETAIDTVCGLWAGWYSATLVDFLSEDYIAVLVEARGMDTQETHVARIDYTGTVTGGLAFPAHPGNVALCLSLRTGLTGRSARGRFYLGGISTSATEDNEYKPAFLEGLVEAFNDWKTLFNASSEGMDWAVTSFYSAGVARTAGRMLPITTITANPRLDTQRRRLGT